MKSIYSVVLGWVSNIMKGKVGIGFGLMDVVMGVVVMDREEAAAVVVVFCRTVVVGLNSGYLKMSSDSRSRSNSRSRSRSPLDRKIRTERYSYRDAPYRRDARRGFRFSGFQSIHLLF